MNSKTPSYDESQAYRYQKLAEPDAIRLVLLQPSQELQSPLACRLISTTLSICQNDLLEHYTALSYVWGDPVQKVTISVDGQTLSITLSLDTALRHLRDSSRIRRIWADAICINQKDFKERNQQVRQMASVYAVAQHTVIWIGEGTPETDDLFTSLRLLSSLRLIGRVTKNQATSIVHRKVALTASQIIIARQWFKRIWVLQELVRSRDPWVQCGALLVKWQDLKRQIGEFALEIGERKVQVLDDMAKLHSEHHLSSHRAIAEHEITDPRMVAGKLLTLLTSRRALGVQDPRDMLFAHVGLLGEVGAIDESLLPLIEVDYGKEETLVFFEIARFLTEAFQDYRILSLIEYRHAPNEKHLPSWVPDWTNANPLDFETLSSGLKLEDTTSATYFPPNPRSISFWVPKARVLACAGWPLARIQSVSSEVYPENIHPKSKLLFDSLKNAHTTHAKHHCKIKDLLLLLVTGFTESYENWKRILSGTDTPDPGKVLDAIKSQLEAFEEPYDPRLFLNTSRLFETTSATTQSEQTLRDGLQRICDYLTEELLPQKPSPLLGKSQSSNHAAFNFETQSLLAHLTVRGFGKEAKSIFRYRKLAILEDGTPALVPEPTTVGDVIAILVRHAIPLVLRPIEAQTLGLEQEIRSQIVENGYHHLKKRNIEHFEVVGECFVEGLMYGEAYKSHKSNLSRQPRVLAFH